MVITLIVLVVGLLLVAGAVAYVLERRRCARELKERFGSEYDRTLAQAGGRRRGERQLIARQKRHDVLDIRPLDPARARDYRAGWETAQARFVDDPRGAIGDADTLIEAIMGERGYPIGDFDQRLEDLSVQHADVLQQYRAAHDIAGAAEAGDADTEAMRRALVHYRALFSALLDDGVEQNSRQRDDDGHAYTTGYGSRRKR